MVVPIPFIPLSCSGLVISPGYIEIVSLAFAYARALMKSLRCLITNPSVSISSMNFAFNLGISPFTIIGVVFILILIFLFFKVAFFGDFSGD